MQSATCETYMWQQLSLPKCDPKEESHLQIDILSSNLGVIKTIKLLLFHTAKGGMIRVVINSINSTSNVVFKSLSAFCLHKMPQEGIYIEIFIYDEMDV